MADFTIILNIVAWQQIQHLVPSLWISIMRYPRHLLNYGMCSIPIGEQIRAKAWHLLVRHGMRRVTWTKKIGWLKRCKIIQELMIIPKDAGQIKLMIGYQILTIDRKYLKNTKKLCSNGSLVLQRAMV